MTMADDPATRPARLLFVYNADGGPVSAILDAVHKIVSPQTYACSLCFITYGAVSMRREWKSYIERLPYPAEFLHRDEFRSCWPQLGVPLPAILIQEDGGMPSLLVEAAEMPADLKVEQLAQQLDRALARYEAGQAV